MRDPGTNDQTFDMIAVGETMAAFVSRDDRTRFTATPAGAESNVAIGMARLGCRTRWVSRLGNDPLGRLVADAVAAAGVDVASEVDPGRPTGVLVKHILATGSRVDYYRSESAARALHPRDLDRAGSGRIWHVTGITPALSPTAADLVRAIVGRRGNVTGLVSFDVNFRPALWPNASTAARTLLPLARDADVVFIGDDESETLFGTSDPASVASLILRRADQELVLKRGAQMATVITHDGEVSEPALTVDVIDVTGAGDAFAAGYLAGTRWDWSMRARLRLGHLLASQVIQTIEDTLPSIAPDALRDIAPDELSSGWPGPGQERD